MFIQLFVILLYVVKVLAYDNNFHITKSDETTRLYDSKSDSKEIGDTTNIEENIYSSVHSLLFKNATSQNMSKVLREFLQVLENIKYYYSGLFNHFQKIYINTILDSLKVKYNLLNAFIFISEEMTENLSRQQQGETEHLNLIITNNEHMEYIMHGNYHLRVTNDDVCIILFTYIGYYVEKILNEIYFRSYLGDRINHSNPLKDSMKYHMNYYDKLSKYINYTCKSGYINKNLKIVIESIENSEFETALLYFQMLKTKNHIYNVIDKICNDQCRFESFYKILNFVNRMPHLEMRINGYLHLHKILMKDSLMERAHVIVFNLKIKDLLIDLPGKVGLKVVTQFEELKNKTDVYIEKLFNTIVTRTIILSGFPRVQYYDWWSGTGLEEVSFKEFLQNLPINITKLYIHKLLNDLNKIKPANTKTVCLFFRSTVVNVRLTVYEKLIEEIFTNKKPNSEIFKLAKCIEDEANSLFFAGVKKRLPLVIQNLMHTNQCMLKSNRFKEYLYISNSYFVNDEDIIHKENNYILTTAMSNNSKLSNVDNKFKWYLQYNKNNSAFLIRDFTEGKLLSIGEVIFHTKRKLILDVVKFNNKNQSAYWVLEPIGNLNNSHIKFIIRTEKRHGGNYLFLSTTNSVDLKTHNVYLTSERGSSVSYESLWEVDCDYSANDIDMMFPLKHRYVVKRNTEIFLEDKTEEEFHIDKFFSFTDNNKSYGENKSNITLKGAEENFLKDILFLQIIKELNLERHVTKRISLNTTKELLNKSIQYYIGNSTEYLQRVITLEQEYITYNKHLNLILNKDIQIETRILNAIINEPFIKNLTRNNIKVEKEKLDLCNLIKSSIKHIKRQVINLRFLIELLNLARTQNLNFVFFSDNETQFQMYKYSEIMMILNETVIKNEKVLNFNCLDKKKYLFKDIEILLYDEYSNVLKDQDYINSVLNDCIHFLETNNIQLAIIYFLMLDNYSKLIFDIINEIYENHDSNYINQIFPNLLQLIQRSLNSEIGLNCYKHLYSKRNGSLLILSDINSMTLNLAVHELVLETKNETHFAITGELEIFLSQIEITSNEIMKKWAKIIINYIVIPKEINFLDKMYNVIRTPETKKYLLGTFAKYIYEEKIEKHIKYEEFILILDTLAMEQQYHNMKWYTEDLYDAVMHEMMLNYTFNREEIQKYAKHLLHNMNLIPGYRNGDVQDLEDILPNYIIEEINKGPHCYLKNLDNIGQPFLLYETEAFFSNNVMNTTEINFSDKIYSAFLEKQSFVDKFKWLFVPVPQRKTFLLKSFRDSYLSVGRRMENNHYKIQLVPDSNKEFTPTEWKMELYRQTKYHKHDFFTVKSFNTGDTPMYLFADHGVVYCSPIIEQTSYKALWEISCPREAIF